MQPLSRLTLPAGMNNALDASADIGIRVGKVTNYDTGSITVQISGTDVLVNAAYLSSYFPNIGDLVAVLKYGASWLVLGGYGQTQSRYIPVAAVVNAIESTSNTSPTDLTTPGPSVTVTVGASGQALVSVNAFMWTTSTAASPNTGQQAYASFTVTDPTGTSTFIGDGAGVIQSAIIAASASPLIDQRFGAQYLMTGMIPGKNTFTMKYRSGDGNAVSFGNRVIIVTPY